MMELPKTEQSIWSNPNREPTYPQLQGSIDVDVCIVGGGIAGLTSAYFLTRAGKSVAVLEKNLIGSGVSGHTTGKVTAGHNVIYQKLLDRQGLDTAKHYAEANQAAVKIIEYIVRENQIDCDWQPANNYVVTETPEDTNTIYREAQIAKDLGLNATFERETSSPFWTEGAVCYTGQSHMHVGKYLHALAAMVQQNGGLVYEKTKAKRVREKPHPHVRVKGGLVKAEHIIIATNIPFSAVAHGWYCALAYPQKSYIIAIKTNAPIHGMYIMYGSPGYSVLPVVHDGEQLVLVGGEGHIPGLGARAKKHHAKLADFAERRLGAHIVSYRWSARDYLGYDLMPLIGKLYPWSKHTYTATGFMKWGLSNGTLAAMILSDQILGHENTWARSFASNRSSAFKAIPRVILQHVLRIDL